MQAAQIITRYAWPDVPESGWYAALREPAAGGVSIIGGCGDTEFEAVCNLEQILIERGAGERDNHEVRQMGVNRMLRNERVYTEADATATAVIAKEF